MMTDHRKIRFDEVISQRIANKGKNNQLFTSEQYLSLIIKVKESKNKVTKKTPEDYQRLARYDVLKTETSEKLIVPIKNTDDPVIYYAHLNESYQIINDCHISIGHAGRIRMMKELKLKYKNITAELVSVYLNLCESCQRKKSLPKKEFANNKPIIINNELNSRCQIDVLDMQSQADGDYKFIMVYQDIPTKFVQLRPLKGTEEIAPLLLDIFTIFGAPSILQSDNGREFASNLVSEVRAMWPELKIVHGIPQQSEAQDSVEWVQQDVEKMLCAWLEANSTTQWSSGLRFIQFTKNREYRAGINRSPYEAMFGCKAKAGLSNVLPEDVLLEMSTEEELEHVLNERENQLLEEKQINEDENKLLEESTIKKEID